MNRIVSPTVCLHGVLAVAVSLTLGACASTVVKPEFEKTNLHLQRPERILVYDFAVSAREVTENQGPLQGMVNEFQSKSSYEHQREIADEVQKVAAEEIVEKLLALGLPAERAPRGAAVPAKSLAITGQFIDVDEGNKARRMVIGFGAGKSRVDMRVQMFGYGLDAAKPEDVSPVKLADFQTNADSGKMPGALVTAGAGAAAQGGMTAGVAAANVGIGGVKAYRSAMGQMTSRSADQAVNYMSEYFGQQGWIPSDKVKKGDRP